MANTEIISDAQGSNPSEQEIIACMRSLELSATQTGVYLTRENLRKVALGLLSGD